MKHFACLTLFYGFLSKKKKNQTENAQRLDIANTNTLKQAQK